MKGMKKLNIAAMGALCAAMAVPAAFAGFTSPKVSRSNGKLQARETTATVQAYRFNNTKQAPAVRGHRAAEGTVLLVNGYAPEDLGTTRLIMEEDFSKITEGEFLNPVETNMTISASSPEYTYPWFNMKPEYTKLPNWGCDESVLPAGGMVCLDAVENGCKINTPTIDVSGSKLSLIEMKVYSPETSSETFMGVEAAETFGMSPTWDFLDNGSINVPQGAWHDVKLVVYGGQKSTLYNIYLASPGTQLYIDDIKVSQIEPFVGIPDILTHADYQGTSLKVRWTACEGAESYLVNVYERAYGGFIGDEVYADLPAAGNELTVEGLESGVPYFFEVRAVNGVHTGYPSTPKMIWDVEAPALNSVPEIKDYAYTASWGSVPNGDVYNYWAYGKRLAEKEGPFTITKEKFNLLTDHDGNRMEWTHEDNEGRTYSEYDVQGGVKQMGWRAKHSAPFKDYLCIDGWWYIVGKEDAGLLSPEFDLSADGGKATLSMTLASEFLPADWNEYGIDLQVQCAVAVFAWDDAKEDYSQVFLTYPGEVSLRWTKFTCQLEGLTDRCVIGIYAVGAPGNLYISDLELTQNRKTGDAFMDPFCFKRYHTENELEVEIPAYVKGTEVYHRVGATAGIVESNGWEEYLVKQDGGFSELAYVGKTLPDADVPSLNLGKAAVKVADGVLTVTNPCLVPVAVLTADGRTVATGTAATMQANLPGRGVYFVTCGNETLKICW